MKNKDDILLKQFFDQNKQQIADNGFSEKVMQRIPQQQSARPYIIWQIVCICLGVVLFLTCGGIDSLCAVWQNMFANIMSYLISIDLSGVSPLMLLATICAVLYGSLWLIKENLDV